MIYERMENNTREKRGTRHDTIVSELKATGQNADGDLNIIVLRHDKD
jgi:hypothetical protein